MNPINAELEPCCRRTLELIKTKRELNDSARGLLASTPLILMLAGMKPIELAFTVSTTDFAGLAQASSNFSKITQLAIVRDVQHEVIRHSRDKELRLFWQQFLNAIK